MAALAIRLKRTFALVAFISFALTAYLILFDLINPFVTRSPTEILASWKNKSYSSMEDYIHYSTLRLGLKALIESRPIRPEFGPVINDVTYFQYPRSARPCQEGQQFFVSVISAPSYFEKRQAIRGTWVRNLNETGGGYAFIMGMTNNKTLQVLIEEESMAHGDIIQVDMTDTYHNLTLKAVSLLNWLHTFCPAIPFVLKADDDLYVNVRLLASLLPHLPAHELSIYGRMNNRIVQRTNNSKWYSSYEEWPWTCYPPYLSGGGILISGQAIEPLLAAAQVTPYFWVDDTYLTGLLASKAGVALRVTRRYSSITFDYNRLFTLSGTNTTNVSDPCFVSAHVSWMTQKTPMMNASHRTVEDYYSSRDKCFLLDSHAVGNATNSTVERPPSGALGVFYQTNGELVIRLDGDG